MTSRTEYNTEKPKKSTLFSGQYLRNHWTLDIGVLGYIGIVWTKEHSPEFRSFPPGTPCLYTTIFRELISSALCRYWFEVYGCTFVMFLYSMRPYVIIVCCLCVGMCVCVCLCAPEVPLLGNLIHGIQINNGTNHCPWAPWRWSYILTETCRGKFF
jgi:hypothetical protein